MTTESNDSNYSLIKKAMKLLKTSISESISDSSVQKWKRSLKNHYWFSIDEYFYDVTFTPTNKSVVKISFTIDHPDWGGQKQTRLMKTGNAQKVLSTVIDIWKDYIEKNPSYKLFQFESIGQSRTKAYRRILQRNSNWIESIQESPSPEYSQGTIFTVKVI